MKALTHNIQQEREDQRDRSAQLFMWCIVVSMHQDDGIGASRLLRACNEMDAFEKKYQTAILYGSSKNATDAMRENLKGICDFAEAWQGFCQSRFLEITFSWLSLELL